MSGMIENAPSSQEEEAGSEFRSLHEVSVRAAHTGAQLIFRKGLDGWVRVESKGDQIMKLAPAVFSSFVDHMVQLKEMN